MERVRRNKMCFYLKETKLNKRKKCKSKTKHDVPVQGENVSDCSNDLNVCHPYEDKINLVHVMADVLPTAKNLHQRTFWHWDEMFTFTQPSQTNDAQYRRYSNASSNLIILTSEVYYADKRRAWCKAAEHYETIFSRMEGNQNRKVLDCGNYIDHADYLIKMAKQSIASSENITKKQIHLKKLKLFQGLNKCKI